MKKEHYEEMITEAKGLSLYSTLCTCPDTTSGDWNHTTMLMKVGILKKFPTRGTTLQYIVMGVYEIRNKKNQPKITL